MFGYNPTFHTLTSVGRKYTFTMLKICFRFFAIIIVLQYKTSGKLLCNKLKSFSFLFLVRPFWVVFSDSALIMISFLCMIFLDDAYKFHFFIRFL